MSILYYSIFFLNCARIFTCKNIEWNIVTVVSFPLKAVLGS